MILVVTLAYNKRESFSRRSLLFLAGVFFFVSLQGLGNKVNLWDTPSMTEKGQPLNGAKEVLPIAPATQGVEPSITCSKGSQQMLNPMIYLFSMIYYVKEQLRLIPLLEVAFAGMSFILVLSSLYKATQCRANENSDTDGAYSVEICGDGSLSVVDNSSTVTEPTILYSGKHSNRFRIDTSLVDPDEDKQYKEEVPTDFALSKMPSIKKALSAFDYDPKEFFKDYYASGDTFEARKKMGKGIAKSFRKKSRKLHPDKNLGVSNELFKAFESQKTLLFDTFKIDPHPNKVKKDSVFEE